MAYWNTSANLLTTWQAWKLLLFAVQLLFVMKITVRFRQLFFLRIDEFIADFCSFEIGYRWSSTVSLYVFECIIERAIACE